MLLMLVVLNMFSFQVQDNDIWNSLNGHELMQYVGTNNTTYVYMKRRVMETIVKLLETRTNPHGYAYHHRFYVFSVFEFFLIHIYCVFMQDTRVQVSRFSG